MPHQLPVLVFIPGFGVPGARRRSQGWGRALRGRAELFGLVLSPQSC